MMKHGYSLTLVLTLLVATSGLAFAQQQRAPFMPAEASAARSAASIPAITSPNPVVDGRFGDAVASLGDVDGDGAGDVLIGAPGEIVDDTNSGRAYVVSGATGEVVQALVSPRPTTPGGAFGGSVSGVPDADGDEIDDYIIGAANEDVGAANAGRAYLFSGATGDLLQTLESPVPPINGFFGTSVSGVPDIDGDGRGDVVVGAPGESDTSGRIYLFSGATGDLLRTVLSPNPESNGLFGFVVAGMDDVNGDGRGDVAVGAFGENFELQNDGQAYILDGTTGEVIHLLSSPLLTEGGQFGISLARVPDADGDGLDDLLVAADGEAMGAGQAHLFSGETGLLLRTLESPNPEEGGGFGFRVSGVPDVDGDGRGDLLIGAFSETVLGDADAGRAYLFSGQTGSLLRTLTSLSSFRQGEFFGVAVAGVSDVNGDGAGDLLVGAPLGDPSFPNRGSAYLFSGADAPPVAVDDAATTVEGFPGFADVLANDFDLNADDLFVESVGTAMNGTTLIVGDGVRYTPNPGFIGTDSFTYTVGDGLSGSDEGTVMVTVNEIPENVQPFAAADSETNDSFGIGVSSVPDVNGDGITDFAIGSADENGIETRGRAYLYDGATGNLIRTLSSPDPQFGGGFGISVAGVSDVNGDGAGDLLVGAYLEDVGDTPSAGRAYLFSGASGILLRTLESSSLDSFNFGWQVAAVPDVDGDAIEDLIIGTQGSPAHLFSGASGLLLQTLEPPSPDGGIFGFSVAGLSDIDGDGSGDVAVGDFFAGEENEGAVYLFSGATGLLIRTLTSPNPELASFFSFPLDGISDVNGDGIDDVLVGAFSEDGGATNAGRAYIFDSVTGNPIRTLTSPNSEPSGNFGIGLASVPDADGDGQEDILVGAWNENAVTGGGGRAYLFSGESGVLLRTVESPAAESGGVFGRTVAGVPDLDGDGLGELLIGARGEDGGALNAGRAYLFRSGQGGMPPIAEDDLATTAQDTPVTIDVLANDSDPDGDPLAIDMVGSPMSGTAEVVLEQIRYTPALGFSGIDSFTYTVSDGTGGTDEALVTVTVTQSTEGIVPLTSPNVESLGFFGRSVAAVPDADGDGRDDLLVGANLEDGELPDEGRAYLFSGATGTLLQTLASPNPEDSGFFGWSVAGVPDADGDGRGDLLVGAILEDGEFSDEGRAYLFSGATGALLQTLDSPTPAEGGSFGASLAGVPDVDGDGQADLLVGANAEAEANGQAHLFSGATGLPIRTLTSPNPEFGGRFGVSVSGVADADGDGRVDLLVGAFREDAGATDAGRAYLFSGASGALLQTLASPNSELDGQFGNAVAGVADADGDGRGDLLIGASSEDGGAENSGRAHLYSGATGLLIRTLNSPNAELGGAFGISVSGVADVDGDGEDDFLVGAFLEDALAMDAGRAYLFSGASGAVLRTLESPNGQVDGFFGDTVAGLSDADGDGRGDLLISAPFEDVGQLTDAGRAYVFLSGDGEMEITVTINFPEGAQAGADVPVRVTIEGFETTAVELRYRPTGAPAFGAMPLTMDADAYTGMISGELVTLRGLDYYIEFTDGETTFTFPEIGPELNPLRLQVGVAQQAADVDLPPNAEYRMVSVPAVLDTPDPLAVFGDDYGEYGETSWRLLRWVPGLEQYAELIPPDTLPDRPVIETPVVPGTAFWLAAYADAPFDIDNARSVDATEPVTVVLQPGWNQMGNPFAFPVDWNAVLGSDLVQPPVLYDGTEYLQDQLVLDPWVGYFVFNPELEPVFLEVPPIESLGEVRSSNARLADAVGYRLRLRAEVPERDLRDTQNVFGFAEAEPERLARAEPPPIGPHLRLSAVEDGRRLAHSFRPASRDGGDWELEVTATPSLLETGPLAVRVALDELGVRPADFDLHVLDLDRTAPVVLEDGTFELELRADRPVRRLRLIAGTDAYADAARDGVPLEPLDFALAPAYPNPFAGSATLAYDVAERTDVVLDVFDILGRRVAVLADGVHDAGRYTVQWDGRTAGGARAANGVYLYRLRAGSFTATHKVVLLR